MNKGSTYSVRWAVLALVIVALFVTFSAWRYAEMTEEAQANERFQFRMQQIKAALRDRMLAYEHVLRGGVGLFASSGNHVSRAAWHAYVETLNIDENYPGIQGLGFSKHILPDELSAHEAEIRRQGYPDYAVRPAGKREEYTSIIYLEPFDQRNQRAFGFDMFSESTRRAAMEWARDSGKTSLSGKVKLVQEANKDVQAGFLMYLPVYQGGLPQNVVQRKAALLGYVYSPFRMNDLMKGVLGKSAPDLALKIYDGTGVTDNELLYSSQTERKNSPSIYSDTQEIDINGHVWTLQFNSLPLFEAGLNRHTPKVIAVSGIALTVLLALLFWSVLSTRARAQTMANVMTASLRENEERLRSVVDTAMDSIVVISENGIIESCNAATQRIFGYSADEMAGHNFSMLMPEISPHQHDGYLERFSGVGQDRGKGADREVVGLRKDGSTFPMELSVGEMHAGNQRKYTGTLRDITERKQAQKKLDDQFRFITELLETIPAPVYFKDVEGRYLGFNRAFEEFFGVKREQMLGKAVSALYEAQPEVAEFHRNKDLELMRHQVPQSFEAAIPTIHGLRYTFYSKAPFYREDGALAGLIGVIYDITERKQADDALRETMQLQRAILDSASYAIISTGLDGTILAFNAAAERMLGYKAQDLLGKETPAIFHLPEEVVARAAAVSKELGQDIKPGFEVFVAKARLGVADENEWTYVRKDGVRVPVLLSVTAQSNERGEITGFLGMASDISVRKAIETALHESEARYRMIAEYSSDMISQFSAEGTLIYVSPASATLMGYEPAEMLGKSMFEWIHPDDVAIAEQKLKRVMETYVLDTLTCRVRTREGNYIWLETSLRGLRDKKPAAGGASQVVGISRDVTERVEIAANLNRFKHVLDNTLDMLFMFEPDTLRFVYLNKGAVENMGYSKEELLQMAPYQIKPLIPEPKFRELIAPLLSGEKQSLNFETVHRRKDGSEFPVEILLQLVKEDDGKGLFVALVRDITERQKVDRMKSEFVSTVSHELRTPLTSIRGSLGLVLGGVTGELPVQSKSLLDIAYKNTERLVRLINDILDIEKIESGKMSFDMKPQSLMPIIEQAIETNHAYGDQFGVKYEMLTVMPEVQVNVDHDRLMQVMANLLSNAAKFSPPNGRVEIAVSPWQGRIRVSVTDHGEGIPEAFRSKIFQKFSQADASDTKQKGGTGLGLSISKAMVEKMDGDMGFESRIGEGSSFYFDLPEWRADTIGIPDEESHKKSAADLPRILVCEDDQDIARLLDMMLENGGFKVDVAYDAVQAKALLQQHQYAAMTLDLGLPGQDGVSLIRELRASEATADLPIVVVSARADEGQAEIKGGFSVVDWLGKPIDQQRLIAQLEKATNKISHSRPRVLHVEDDPDIRQVVSALVKEMVDLDYAATLEDARAKLQSGRYTLVILDLDLPDGSGWELLPLLKESGQQTPVMIFSASNVAAQEAQQVAATLLKSGTTNQELLDTISALAKSGIYQ